MENLTAFKEEKDKEIKHLVRKMSSTQEATALEIDDLRRKLSNNGAIFIPDHCKSNDNKAKNAKEQKFDPAIPGFLWL